MSKEEFFATIGSDGMREVVWGVGGTEKGAEQDADYWSSQGTGDPQITRTVRITSEVYRRIKAGCVSTVDLGIDT